MLCLIVAYPYIDEFFSALAQAADHKDATDGK
jgi:hypothetical protein